MAKRIADVIFSRIIERERNAEIRKYLESLDNIVSNPSVARIVVSPTAQPKYKTGSDLKKENRFLENFPGLNRIKKG